MAKNPGEETSVTVAEPKTADEFNERGWSHYSKKEFFRAEADFRKALELSPENPEFLYGLAMSLNASSRPQDAIQAFEKAIQGLENPPDELKVRFHMLARFARGHINRIRTGDWQMR